ncbi:hypothetical protein C8R45DRAFT_922754 [Mycena sanguinolenta]|nr:hypothetical protein C8R45DRAFT_922754 [Mycena sanguinolenta]
MRMGAEGDSGEKEGLAVRLVPVGLWGHASGEGKGMEGAGSKTPYDDGIQVNESLPLPAPLILKSIAARRRYLCRLACTLVLVRRLCVMPALTAVDCALTFISASPLDPSLVRAITTPGSRMRHDTLLVVHIGLLAGHGVKTACPSRCQFAHLRAEHFTLTATVIIFCTLHLEVAAAPFAWRRPHRKRKSWYGVGNFVTSSKTAQRRSIDERLAPRARRQALGCAQRNREGWTRVACAYAMAVASRAHIDVRRRGWERMGAAKAASPCCRRERPAQCCMSELESWHGGRRSALSLQATNSAALAVSSVERPLSQQGTRFLYPASKSLSRRPSHRVVLDEVGTSRWSRGAYVDSGAGAGDVPRAGSIRAARTKSDRVDSAGETVTARLKGELGMSSAVRDTMVQVSIDSWSETQSGRHSQGVRSFRAWFRLHAIRVTYNENFGWLAR